MLIATQDLTLDQQITENNLIYNTTAPGVAPLRLAEIDWDPLTFAEYTLTNTPLAKFLPHGTFSGDPVGFITQAYENALGRAPEAAGLAFYENVISHDHNGYALTLVGISLSNESYIHNPHIL